MIKEIEGDLLDSECDMILHGCNCFCTMGAGLALQIKKRFPEAEIVDRKTVKGDKGKLGKYTAVKSKGKIIINCYTQYGIGGERALNYEAIYQCFENVENDFGRYFDNPKTLGIPYKIGCGLAGGDWNVVKAMIYSVFENSKLDVRIVKRKWD